MSDPAYMLKWKSRETGPYTVAEIEAMLASREIRAMHEVCIDGEWKTVRSFLRDRQHTEPARLPAPKVVSSPVPPANQPVAPFEQEDSDFAETPIPQTEDLLDLPVSDPDPHPFMDAPLPTAARATETLVYAGFWVRLLAASLDVIVVGCIPLLILHRAARKDFFVFLQEKASDSTVLFAVLIMLLSFLWWLYCAGMESSPQRGTLGKRMTGLVVTDEAGRRIPFGAATIRHFSKALSALLIGAGFFLAAFTRKKQAFHDLISECTVNIVVPESRILRFEPSSDPFHSTPV